MKEIELFLVRHQESRGNRARIIQGQVKGRLSPKGHNNASRIASFLAGLGSFDALYSSDQRRAIQTARPIKEKLGMDYVHRTPLLRERSFGKLEEKPYSAVLTQTGAGEPVNAQLRRFSVDANQAPFREMDVEWLSGIEQRAAQFVTHLLSQPHQRVIVVGHYLMNNYLLNHLLHQEIGNQGYPQAHNEIYRVIIDKKGNVKHWEKLTAK